MVKHSYIDLCISPRVIITKMATYKPLLAAATLFTRRAARRRISIISSCLIVSLLFPMLLYLLLGNILANDPRLVPHAIRNAQNVLFITAHPDDGTLYFGPSILQSLGRKNVNRYMLVLSSGGPSPRLPLLIPKSFYVLTVVLHSRKPRETQSRNKTLLHRILLHPLQKLPHTAKQGSP